MQPASLEFPGAQMKKRSCPHTLEYRLNSRRPFNKPASFPKSFPFHLSFHPTPLLPLTPDVLVVFSADLPGSSPQCYSQVGMLGPLGTPPGAESWPAGAGRQLSRPWLAKQCCSAPPLPPDANSLEGAVEGSRGPNLQRKCCRPRLGQ